MFNFFDTLGPSPRTPRRLRSRNPVGNTPAINCSVQNIGRKTDTSEVVSHRVLQESFYRVYQKFLGVFTDGSPHQKSNNHCCLFYRRSQHEFDGRINIAASSTTPGHSAIRLSVYHLVSLQTTDNVDTVITDPPEILCDIAHSQSCERFA